MRANFLIFITLYLVAGTFASTAVYAAPDRTSDDWQFTLAPLFLWGMSVNGNSQLGPVSAPVQIDFDDALEDLSAVFTIHFEAYKKDLSLFAEYQYVELEPSASVPNGSPKLFSD